MFNIQVKWLVRVFMRRVLALLILLSMLGQIQASPEGIDDIADDGCVCHGGIDDTVSVILDGLPDEYNSSEEYNITLTIESEIEVNEVQGGFRILISEGEIIGDGWQYIKGGYTHTGEINDRRVWNAVWIAPAENDALATFVIHGNTVNGNNEVSGDEWNSLSIAVPGTEYTGDKSAPELTNSSIKSSQIIVAVLAAIILIVLTVPVIRDSLGGNTENKSNEEDFEFKKNKNV